MKRLSIALLLLTVISCKNEVKQVANVPYFKTGDILYPDYAISDTLIVVNAIGLNKGMTAIEQGLIDATDGEIAKVFYSHCRIK